MSCPICETTGGCLCPALVTSLRAEAERLRNLIVDSKHYVTLTRMQLERDGLGGQSQARQLEKRIDVALSPAQPSSAEKEK